jgi:hypothetical protein
MDSTVQDLNDLVAASRNVRRKIERQMLLNLAFEEGRQWLAVDRSGRLFKPAIEPWRELVVDNRIRPVVRTEIAKMTKTRPQWVAVPRTADDEDIAAARLAERALEWQFNQLDLLRKLRAALLWSRICGAGFWKVWWDPNKGDSTQCLVYAPGHEQEGQIAKDGYGSPLKPEILPQLPPDVAETLQPKTVNMGDVCVDLRTPFDVYPDPLAGEEGLESAEWVAEEAVYSKQYLKRRFPDQVDKLNFDARPTTGIAESRLPGFMEDTVTGYDAARVSELWEKPSPDHQNGRYVCWSGDTVLAEHENPFPWLPYVMFRGIPVPGRFWPDAPVSNLVSPQCELNKRKAQIAENAERTGNPVLLRSAQNEDVEWNTLPGGEVVFQDIATPGSVPQWMQPPILQSYVENDVDRWEQAIREISGQHEVSSAQVPTGVTAASAISLLQEQDDTRLGPDIADMEQALAGAGRRLNYLMANYYTDQRFIRIAGDDSEWDIEAFKGTMLDDQQDVECQVGSGLPASKAAKQAAIQTYMNLFVQNGIPLSARDLRRILRDSDVGGLEHFFASMTKDEEQINEENRQLLKGNQLPINSYDDDELHVAGHSDMQKTSRYANSDDSVKAVTEAHVQAHRDRIAAKQMANMPPPEQMQLPGVSPPQQNGVPPTPALPSPATIPG